MLVLASHSPRRREILTVAGIEFVVRAALVREEGRAGEAPAAYVFRLAEEKTRAVEGRRDARRRRHQRVSAARRGAPPRPQDAADAPLTLGRPPPRTPPAIARSR